MPDLAVFGESLDGELFSPDSPGYEAIRRPVNPAFREVRPRLVVLCRSVSDVVERHDVRDSHRGPRSPRGAGGTASRADPRRTGSCSTCPASTASVWETTGAPRSAPAPAWGRSTRRCTPMAGPAGRVRPTVGITGLTLGGGRPARAQTRADLRSPGRRAGRARRRRRRGLRPRPRTGLVLGAAWRGRRAVRRGHGAAVRHRPRTGDDPHRGALVGRRAGGTGHRLASLGTGRPGRTHRQPRPGVRSRRTGPGHPVRRRDPRGGTDPGAAAGISCPPGGRGRSDRVARRPALPRPEEYVCRPAVATRTRGAEPL